MPRLPPALIRQANSEHPHLTLLLRVCRDLSSARNELRWLQEHARDVVNAKRYATNGPTVPHGNPRFDTSEKPKSPAMRKVRLDHTEVEDSHIPIRALSQHSLISKHFAGQGFGKKYTKDRENIVEHPGLHSLTSPAQNASESQIQEGSSGEVSGDYRKFRYQSLESKTTRRKTPRQAFDSLQVKHVKPRDISEAQKVPSQTFTIRSGRDGGSRKVRQYRKTGEALPGVDSVDDAQVQQLVGENVAKRSAGMPLQYILGNQPFGNLDILCRKHVLIPRLDTEIYTDKMANLLLSTLATTDLETVYPWQKRKKFRILDLCTGSGCIALLLHSILKPIGAKKVELPAGLEIEILGVDSSPNAIDLARQNLEHNIAQKHLRPDALHTISFHELDVLALAKKPYEAQNFDNEVRAVLNAAAARVPGKNPNQFSLNETWDMIIANPPYISSKDYGPGGKTEKSVRNYEPKKALVPVAEGRFRSPAFELADLFYPPLMRIARHVDAQLLVMEVGDSSQALRVGKQVFAAQKSEVVSSAHEKRLETWRDDGTVRVLPTDSISYLKQAFDEGVNSEVSERAIVVWSGPMADWRRQHLSEDQMESLSTLDRTTERKANRTIGQVKAAVSPRRKPMELLVAAANAQSANRAVRDADTPSQAQLQKAADLQKHAENLLSQWRLKLSKRGISGSPVDKARRLKKLEGLGSHAHG